MGRAGDIFSYSRLSTLDNCPRAYEFRYVRKLKEAFTSVESFVGRIVHHTLGWMYSERERSGAPTEAAAVEKFDQEWDGRFGSWVRVIRRDDSAEARRAIGQEMVRRYHRGAFAEDDLRTVGVERRLDVDLEGGRRYRGIVDRLAEDGEGALHVVDFKTTARPPATHDEQKTLQIRSYGLAVLRNHDVDAVEVSYRYLADGSSHALCIDRAEAERVAAELVSRIDRAESTTSFPPLPSALCAWCGYRESCDVSGFAAAGTDDSCPRCDGVLRERQGRFGPFLGCSNYPTCRFTRN